MCLVGGAQPERGGRLQRGLQSTPTRRGAVELSGQIGRGRLVNAVGSPVLLCFSQLRSTCQMHSTAPQMTEGRSTFVRSIYRQVSRQRAGR